MMKSKTLKDTAPESAENNSEHSFSSSLANSFEEHVRQLAEYFYRSRIERDEPGTPEEDWFRAEQLLATIEE
jgi:hypothetical protein